MWLPRMATNAWLLLAFALIAVKISSASALDCYACTSQELLACGSLHFQANQTSLPSVTCETNANACITRVSPAGYIERGCASTPETESCSGSDCSTCNGNNCNGQRFPLSGGLNCLQCAGDSCDSDFEQQAYPCPLHRENDACYTAFSKGMMVWKVSERCYFPAPDSAYTNQSVPFQTARRFSADVSQPICKRQVVNFAQH